MFFIQGPPGVQGVRGEPGFVGPKVCSKIAREISAKTFSRTN